jgi:hypothetical protein
VTVPVALADALRDRYVLDRELGRGGGESAGFKRLIAGGAV